MEFKSRVFCIHVHLYKLYKEEWGPAWVPGSPGAWGSHFPQPIIPPGVEVMGRSPGSRVMAGGSHFPRLLHPINPGTGYLAAYK